MLGSSFLEKPQFLDQYQWEISYKRQNNVWFYRSWTSLLRIWFNHICRRWLFLHLSTGECENSAHGCRVFSLLLQIPDSRDRICVAWTALSVHFHNDYITVGFPIHIVHRTFLCLLFCRRITVNALYGSMCIENEMETKTKFKCWTRYRSTRISLEGAGSFGVPSCFVWFNLHVYCTAVLHSFVRFVK